MQFGFVPGKDTIDAVFILRILEEYLAIQKKLHMCFVDLDEGIWQSSEESHGMGNEKEKNSRSIG